MELIYESPNAHKVPADILHPTSRILFRHWESIRGEKTIAYKSKLDLRKISNILQWLCIIERDPDKQAYHWRLAGSGICKIWGKELTGCDVLTDWPAFEQSVMAQNFDYVISVLQPSITRFRAFSDEGDELGFELLALPMAIDGRPDPVILGALAPFKQPDWTGIRPFSGYEISTLRRIWTDAIPGDEDAAARRPRITRKRTTGSFLQVIDGGRGNEI